MIKKPKDYETLKNQYEALMAGGHKCVIKEAKEAKDNNGKDILVVYFDTAQEDIQPLYFQNMYLKDTRPDKKWSYSGQRTFWVESEWFESNLSKLAGAIEKSNPDVAIWDKNGTLDLPRLKGLKLGVVFGQEEYTKEDYTVGVSTKPRYFCGYEEAPEQKVPERKQAKNKPAPPPNANTDYGFVNVTQDDTEGLPFA